MNEIITLKLDRVSSQQTKTKTKRQSIDVETQFDVVDSPITPPAAEEEPPMWFTTYMAKVSVIFNFDVITYFLKIYDDLNRKLRLHNIVL